MRCANRSTNALTANPGQHARRKHIEMDLYFIRDQVLAGTLDVGYIPSQSQVADCFTKALASPQFAFYRSKLGLFIITLFRLRGNV